MSKVKATTTEVAPTPPAYSIQLHKQPGNLWVGEFSKDGVVVFETGQPNSFAYVYARLDPWFVQAPHTVIA